MELDPPLQLIHTFTGLKLDPPLPDYCKEVVQQQVIYMVMIIVHLMILHANYTIFYKILVWQ